MSSPLSTAVFTGSARERGEQHGLRFGRDVRRIGAMEYYRSCCETEVLGRPSAFPFLRGLHALFAMGLSPSSRDLIAGFCRASGIPVSCIAQATVMPDVMNYLIGSTAAVMSAPTLGCTSAAVWGEETLGGRFLYGRNLDFLGNGLFDRLLLVATHRPDHGVPYVSLSTAGCVVDGMTGLNEEGLSVDVHQHLSADVGYVPACRPILDLSRRILEGCRTIEEAVALAAETRTASAWSLVLTHWKRRRACVLQRAPSGFAVHETPGQRLVWTNTFSASALRAFELDHPSFRESSRLRARRAEELLDARRGRLDVVDLARLLGDHVDPERRRLRGFAQTIAQPNNLTSVVMDPERGELWVGEGPAPCCDSPFRKIALWKDSAPGETLQGLSDPLSSSQRKACGSYAAAMAAWQTQRSVSGTLPWLRAAVQADPQDPAYAYMHGLLCLKAGDRVSASRAFEAGAALPDMPHRALAQKLWLARCLDLFGRRSASLPLYSEVSRRAEFLPLRAAAERGLWRAYAAGADVSPDLFHGDAQVY